MTSRRATQNLLVGAIGRKNKLSKRITLAENPTAGIITVKAHSIAAEAVKPTEMPRKPRFVSANLTGDFVSLTGIRRRSMVLTLNAKGTDVRVRDKWSKLSKLRKRTR